MGGGPNLPHQQIRTRAKNKQCCLRVRFDPVQLLAATSNGVELLAQSWVSQDSDVITCVVKSGTFWRPIRLASAHRVRVPARWAT